MFNKYFLYLLIIKIFFSLDKFSKTQNFIFNYFIEIIFQDIIPNTKTAKVLTVDKSQFMILQSKIPLIKINTIYANKAIICLKSNIFLNIINIIQVDILIGTIKFYVMNTFTPYFFI